MRRLVQVCALLLVGIPVAAQFSVPEIRFDSAADPLRLPDNIHLGEAAGVATNSRGDVFVYTRTGHPTISLGGARAFAHGGSRLFQFDRTGKFVREIGQGLYGFLVAEQVRVDPQDNVWIVDQMSSMVIKFDANGQVQLLLGRKSESERVPALPLTPPPAGQAGEGRGAGGGEGRGAGLAAGRGAGPAGGRGAGPARDAEGPPEGAGRGLPGAGAQSDLFQRPSDVAWDAAGNIYVADGFGNARVAKFDKDGKFIRSWRFERARRGPVQDCSRARDRRAGQCLRRRQRQSTNPGLRQRWHLQDPVPQCGDAVGAVHHAGTASGPLYSSNSNPPEDIDVDGEIYKMELTGRLVGRFGRAGKLPKEFGTVNAIDCRSENELYVAEIGNWRVQKLSLHPN